MACNPVTQDKVGKVFPNADGTYSSLFSDGDKPLVVKLMSPEYSLTESFDGALDPNIWTDLHSVESGSIDPTDAANNVAISKYWPEGDQTDAGSTGDAWSELQLTLPIDAVQIEMGFREYTPASFTSVNFAKQKSIGFHSGPYGITNNNIAVKSECWSRSLGATPSMYTGSDGDNRGHLMTAGSPLMWVNGEGAWHDIHVLLELAETENGFGRYRIWRDGVILIDSNDPDMEASWDGTPSHECIPYSTRGNFINVCRINGWCDKKEASSSAYEIETHFLIDNFYIHANTVHGTTTE